jgi:drug/metabolite transporter (DMT)-like permease
MVANWSAGTWIGLTYLIFVAGVCSQVLYAYGLRDVTPSQAMAFTYLMPVFTAVMAAIMLDEQIGLTTMVCGVAIVFGLWLVNRSRPGARKAASPPTPLPKGDGRLQVAAPGPPLPRKGEGSGVGAP